MGKCVDDSIVYQFIVWTLVKVNFAIYSKPSWLVTKERRSRRNVNVGFPTMQVMNIVSDPSFDAAIVVGMLDQ